MKRIALLDRESAQTEYFDSIVIPNTNVKSKPKSGASYFSRRCENDFGHASVV